MKSNITDNIFMPEAPAAFKRYKNVYNLPPGHPQGSLVVIVPDRNCIPNDDDRCIAYIVEGQSGQPIIGGGRATIRCFTNDDVMSFRDGQFRSDNDCYSIAAPSVPFPVLATKLRQASRAPSQRYQRFAPLHFLTGRKNNQLPPSLALGLFLAWDDFEARGLDWVQRGAELAGKRIDGKQLNELKAECKRLGLKLGQKLACQKELCALTHCLAIIENEHWENSPGGRPSRAEHKPSQALHA